MPEIYGRQDDFRRDIAAALGTADLASGDPVRVKAAQESEWLRSLYGELRSHLEGDLNRQWAILRIFVPLSLAPFAAVVVNDDLSRGQIALLGLASSALLLAANVFSDRLSQFTRKTWTWLGAIEAECGLPSLTDGPVTRHFPVSRVRWTLLFLVVSVWIVLTLIGSSISG